MLNDSPLTPNRGSIPGFSTPKLEKSLIENNRKRKTKQSLIWGSVNICMLSIILFDLSQDCPVDISYFQYLEYLLVIILSLNVFYHVLTYIYLYLTSETIFQKKLFDSKDLRFKSTPNSPNAFNLSGASISTPKRPLQNSISLKPWMPSPINDGSQFVSSWIYSRGAMSDSNNTNLTPHRMYANSSSVDFIEDNSSLSQYLKEYETYEKVANLSNQTEQPTNLLSSFWNHPASKSGKEVSPFLRRCQYQLATHSPSFSSPVCSYLWCDCNHNPCPCSCSEFTRPFVFVNASSSPNKPDEKKGGSPHILHSQSLEMWRKLNVDSVALTRWNENLRTWISRTILDRLVEEFDRIDNTLHKHGLVDISVGAVGLDRLRKTAQMSPVLHFVPTLSVVLPFLELTSNQEYLVKRIRDLARGGCMSEYKWNGGGVFNGKDWDQSLPTDSAIIMHVFASYMDTQLLPLPSNPDAKSFSGFHYIKAGEKPLQTSATAMFIQQVAENPPHFKVIVGENSYDVVKGYNNLFQCILLFLYFVNEKEHGMLGRVNLGRSGVNMLWIINS